MTDEIARRLLIEQTQKELLDEIKKHQVGYASNGKILATQNSGEWDGYVFVIPDGKYQELWGAK